jgi:maleate isomerase
MSDRLGYRLRVGVVVPSFNTSVQPELEALRPPGVTNHVSRIEMPDMALATDADQEAVVESLGADLEASLRRVMGARPGVVIFGISIPTFWRGLAGMVQLRTHLESLAGVPVVLGSEAILAGLQTLPPGQLGVLTPYQPVGDARVRDFLVEAGHDVAAIRSVSPPRNSSIAEVGISDLETALDALVGDGAEVLVQVGTNLAFAGLAAGQARRTGRPVLSVNIAMYDLALQKAGILTP